MDFQLLSLYLGDSGHISLLTEDEVPRALKGGSPALSVQEEQNLLKSYSFSQLTVSPRLPKGPAPLCVCLREKLPGPPSHGACLSCRMSPEVSAEGRSQWGGPGWGGSVVPAPPESVILKSLSSAHCARLQWGAGVGVGGRGGLG